MKTKSLKSKIVFFLSVIIVISITGFVANTDKNKSIDPTKNTELKKDVFNQIINNSELFTEFMNDIMQSSQSMQWMMNNEGMVKYMFSGDHLGYMMHHNPGMNQMMMRNMMNTIQADSTYTYKGNKMMMNN